MAGASVGSPASRAQIPVEERETRREALAAAVGEGAVLAFGAPDIVHHRQEFRQLPAFEYLTGFREPDAALVMLHHDGELRSTLFTEEPSVRTQIYDGFREDPASVARRTGFRVRPSGELDAYVDSLVSADLPLFELRDFRAATYADRDSLTRGAAFVEALQERHPGLEVRDVHPLVDSLRARKSEAEVELLRRAVAITEAAHRAAMDEIAPGAGEYEVEAALEHAFRSRGARGPAFASIVGSGPNSTTLHYVANERRMEAGDVVVIDIGAEVEGYAADLTRTYPVDGTFDDEQRAIYDLVLEALEAAEERVGPGRPASAASEASRRVRFEGMARLGLVESPDARFDPPWPADCDRTPTQCLQGTLFTVHAISHGIGLEVHDPAQFYRGDGTYGVGDTFTLEPGIYVDARLLEVLPDTRRNRAFVEAVRDAVARYDGIGVRIEDDYLVTEEGVERLSGDLPRRAGEIEAAMR